MKEKNIFPFIAVICLILIGIISFCIRDRLIPADSKQIKELYSYLGDTEYYYCGNLKPYRDNITNSDSYNSTDLLCLAYYNIDKDKITQSETKVTGKNDNSVSICTLDENVVFTSFEDKNICTYSSFSKEDLNLSYQKMFGKDVPSYTKFYISGTEECALKEDIYYCGAAEVYNVSFGADIDIYRLIDKAVEKSNKNIVIYDYFLKISNNTCYATTENNDELQDCTNNLSSTIDEKFVKKYGVVYMHTYKKDKNGNYYWYQSEKKR